MAYLSKQNNQDKQKQVAIGKHNRESLLNDAHNENVLFALAHKKPQKERTPEKDQDDEEIIEKSLRRRGPGRSAVS